MGLVGSRSTLIANACALVVSLAVIAEGAYIVHGCFGYYRPQDVWGFLFPAFVMFIVRNRIFSFCFLALYVALSVQMLFQAKSIHVASYACGNRIDDPLGNMMLFFLISVACLVIYPVVALVKFIISVTSEETTDPWDGTQ